MEKTSS